MTDLMTIIRNRFPPPNPGPAPKITLLWRDMPHASKMFFYVAAIEASSNPKCRPWVFTLRLIFTGCSGDVKQCGNDVFRQFKSSVRTYLAGCPRVIVAKHGFEDRLFLHGIINPLEFHAPEIDLALRQAAGDGLRLFNPEHRRLLRKDAAMIDPADWRKSYKGRFGPYGFGEFSLENIGWTQRDLGLRSENLAIHVSSDVMLLAKHLHQQAVEMAERCDPSEWDDILARLSSSWGFSHAA